MPVRCEILFGSEIVDGFFDAPDLPENIRLEWAVRGYFCYPGFLVIFPNAIRVYLRQDICLGRDHYSVTAMISYLNSDR